jgi:hypothetical protein
MEPRLFCFSSFPDPLWVWGSLCANPDCECGEAFIDLFEDNEAGRSARGRPKLSLRIDVENWQESQSPARPESLDNLARDFLREYPAAEQAAWKAEVAAKRQTARRLREYRLDPHDVETAKLVPYGDIVSEHGSLSSGGASAAFRLEYDGAEYLVDDLYCPNPDCHCGRVHLAFFRRTPSPGADQAVIKECFRAMLTLEGDVDSVKCRDGMRKQANAVLKAWRVGPDFERDLEDFQWRYGKIKEIAERNAPPRRPMHSRQDWLEPPAEQLSRPPRAGRNEPCPCGSGKKYKKCCGKADRETPTRESRDRSPPAG